MPIACTRCGVKQEGEILNVVVAFKFPHEKGCGQGIGPLTVIKGKLKKEKPVEATIESNTSSTTNDSTNFVNTDSGTATVVVESEKPKVEKKHSKSKKD